MSIAAECPRCATRLTVPSDKAGKTVRCPNPDCRQPFVVAATRPAAGPPKPTSRPRQAPPPDPDLPHIPADPSDVLDALDAEVVDADPVEEPPAREVLWSPDADLPPPMGGPRRPTIPPAPPKKPAKFEEVRDEPEDEDDEPIVRRKRKKKRNLAPYILIGMLATLLIAGGAIALLGFKTVENEEAKQAEQAKGQYDKQEYPAAAKGYDGLAAKYPGGANGDKYRFFAQLAATQQAVRSVATRDDPQPALELMRRVVARRGRVPAIALTGYGMEEDIQRSRDAGFTAHMTKPIDFAKLEAMIRQVAS